MKSRLLPAAVLLSTLALAAGGAVRAEPTLLSDQASGLLELDGERKLVVSRLEGQIVLRLAKAGGLRYAARSLDDREAEVPLALWVDGDVLTLTSALDEATRALIEVAVPEELSVELDASDARVSLASLLSDVEVVGERLELEVAGLKSPVDLDVTESSVRISSVAAETHVKAASSEVRLEGANADVFLELQESTARIQHLDAGLIVELEAGRLWAGNVAGTLEVTSDRGPVELEDCVGGGRLSLTDAELTLAKTKGSFEVETDAEVRFREHEGDLVVRGLGATVRGVDARGPLTIETDSARVILESIGDTTVIQGQGLEVDVKESRGDLTVRTLYSSVVIKNSMKSLVVHNEYGDIEVETAHGPVEVRSVGGSVSLKELHGTVDVEADATAVEVSWATLQGSDTSTVVNSTGDLHVALPLSTSCKLRAEAPYGRIEAELEGVSVSDDGHYASGLLNAARRAPHVKSPTVELRAGGDLYLGVGR